MSDTDPTQTGAENQEKPTGGDNGQVAQSEIDAIVKARLARAKETWERQMQAKLDEHASEALAAWREENGLTDEALGKLQSVDSQAHELRVMKGKATKAENQLSAEAQRADAAESALRSLKVDGAILEASAGIANNPQELVKLLRDRVKVDPSNGFTAYVVGDDGEPTGQTIGEMVKGYLEQNTHHMPPTASRGAGSKVSADGSPPDGGHDLSTRHGRLAALKGVLG